LAFREIYRRQVQLLIRVLPSIGEEACFALKGGTAINLFVRDMPRLSVDIDLTYLVRIRPTCSSSGQKLKHRALCSKVSIGTPSTPFQGSLVRGEGPDQFFRSSSENAHMAIRSACMGYDELLIYLYTLELGDESRT